MKVKSQIEVVVHIYEFSARELGTGMSLGHINLKV